MLLHFCATLTGVKQAPAALEEALGQQMEKQNGTWCALQRGKSCDVSFWASGQGQAISRKSVSVNFPLLKQNTREKRRKDLFWLSVLKILVQGWPFSWL
jgi:hypothetical protein